jgi:hypothetical protein
MLIREPLLKGRVVLRTLRVGTKDVPEQDVRHPERAAELNHVQVVAARPRGPFVQVPAVRKGVLVLRHVYIANISQMIDADQGLVQPTDSHHDVNRGSCQKTRDCQAPDVFNREGTGSEDPEDGCLLLLEHLGPAGIIGDQDDGAPPA